jgi:hypothetical protein
VRTIHFEGSFILNDKTDFHGIRVVPSCCRLKKRDENEMGWVRVGAMGLPIGIGSVSVCSLQVLKHCKHGGIKVEIIVVV